MIYYFYVQFFIYFCSIICFTFVLIYTVRQNVIDYLGGRHLGNFKSLNNGLLSYYVFPVVLFYQLL